ncbi:outer membrane protein [Noviherbaspirillum aridicola]|nr:outer membrane beta-barrel protein [Noviherbaspirillum aridicola]
MGQNKKCLAVVQAVCLYALAAGAAAENIFSVSSASPHHRPGELRLDGAIGLSMPGARDMTDGAPPSSYGLRFSHYPERHPNWGVGVDFTRYGSGNGIRSQDAERSLWQGALAPGATPLDRVTQRFDQPHGVNVLSVSGIYRWHGDGPAVGRLQPYVGLGLAWYRSNSDGTTPGFARPPAQEGSALGYHMMGGVRYHFTERAGAFFEAKFNSGNALHAVPGDADGSPRSYHAVAGVSYSF